MNMYRLSFFKNGKFETFLGGDIPTLPSAIENLDHMKSILPNVEVISNTSVKYDLDGVTCAILITDRWNQPIYEAKFQESDSDKKDSEVSVHELNPNE